MTRRATLLRWFASLQLGLLAASWVLPAHGGGPCPHLASAGAVQGAGHAGHASAAPPGESPAPDGGQDECRCLGTCCTGGALLLPAGAPVAQVAVARPAPPTAAVPDAEPRPASHLHLLPFSTAPPRA